VTCIADLAFILFFKRYQTLLNKIIYLSKYTIIWLASSRYQSALLIIGCALEHFSLNHGQHFFGLHFHWLLRGVISERHPIRDSKLQELKQPLLISFLTKQKVALTHVVPGFRCFSFVIFLQKLLQLIFTQFLGVIFRLLVQISCTLMFVR
jgi:hypothetical protein